MTKTKKIILVALPTSLILILAIPLLGIMIERFQPAPTIRTQTYSTKTIRIARSFKRKKNIVTAQITSKPIESKFTFNAIAPNWEQRGGSYKEDIDVFIRTSVTGNSWSDWIKIEATTQQKDSTARSSHIYPEVPIIIAGNYFQYKVVIHDNEKSRNKPEISKLKIEYINSEDDRLLTKIKNLIKPAEAASHGKAVISRRSWGSPDPYGKRYRTSSKLWPAEHSKVGQVFIHHTVNKNKQSDPEATIRAIWQYHSQTLGWGDIGYNYLVDQKGRVYEGRWGGDSVEGGHTRSFNAKSMGVALLGCFESGPTCNSINGGTTKGPSNSMLRGLADLLAWKMHNYEVPAKGKHRFCGTRKCKTLDHITGHRFATSTSCPGDLVVKRLPQIRKMVRERKRSGKYPFAARRLDYKPIILGGASEVTNVELRFKNTGRRSWTQSGSTKATLKVTKPDSRDSIFRTPAWETMYTVATINEPSVAPGKIGTFTIPLKRPVFTTKTYYESFKLSINGNDSISNTYTYPVYTPPLNNLYSWQVLSSEAYTDETKNTAADLNNMTVDTPVYMSIIARNDGSAQWRESSSEYGVILEASRPKNRISELCDPSWISCTRVAGITENVNTGAETTLEFWIRPSELGVFDEHFTLKVKDLLWMPSAEFYIRGEVNP